MPDGSTKEITFEGGSLRLPLVQRCAFLRSQSASRITWHSHDVYEILMVLDGSTEYEFRGGRIEKLSGGHFLTVAPSIEHRGHHDVRSPARIFGIQFNPRAPQSTRNTPFTKPDLNWIVRHIDSGAGRSHRMSPEMKGWIKTIPHALGELQTDQPSAALSIRLAICTILLQAAKQFASNEAEPEHVVQSAVDHMKLHLTEPDSIESVSKSIHCSRSRLFTVFKESTGMTPNDYRVRMRIAQAQELLTDSDDSITDIAILLGFSSSQYFSTVFKKYSGQTASEYRESRTRP
jgi:AraC-like DNA-binding protein/mannose-6-phosphate isomerase-like protein (cupin superfamily)